MKKHLATQLGTALAAFTTSVLSAQIAPALSTGSTEKDEAIALSPFTVNADKDTGYAATSTLAGTRLNSLLKDLGASISIYTKSFLNDIGATNANELLVYATGMEAAGPGGNFSGAAGDINAAQATGDAQRTNPQGSTRARGLAAPTFTRNFYPSDIPLDSYNSESVTVSRGPNSILFGVGNAAGVVDTALLKPNLRRDSNRIEVRFGNNDSRRASVDFNRALIPGKLALRIAALDDHERYNQRPAFDNNRRIYSAVAYEPFKSSALRAHFETGRSRANRPITVLPFNSISPAWYVAGRSSLDWTFYDDPARNPAAATQAAEQFQGFVLGQVQVFDDIVTVYSNAAARAPDLSFRGDLASTSGTAANAIRTSLFHPLLNRDQANDAVRFITTRNIQELPAGYWTGPLVLPGQQPGQAPAGIKMQGFTDFSAFDFENRMIDESSFQSGSFHNFNLAIEQRAWRDRIGIELAYDTQRNDRRAKDSFFSANNANHIRIDANVVLPTGQPNPNLGRPYANAQYAWGNTFTERETKRATVFLRYDFKDLKTRWAHWLGRHTLTGLREEGAIDTIGYTYKLATDGPAATDVNAIPNTFARRGTVLVYLGPSIIGNNNPLRLEPIQIPELVAGPAGITSRFVRAANATDPGSFVPAATSFVEVTNGGNAQREVIKSQAAVLQSYWLQEHLVTLFGWRRDEDYFQRKPISYIPNPTNANDAGKVHYGFGDIAFPRTPPPNVAKEITSYSVVLKWPQRFFRLPARSELSIFYNVSENFAPAGGRVNAYNQPLASPQGETREYGLNLSTSDHKFSLRVNRFETVVTGQTATSAAFSPASNNAVMQVASFWVAEGNNNPENVPFMDAAVARLFSDLPSDFATLRQFGKVGTAPNISATFGNLSGVSDTAGFTAKGTEIDVVYNPTRNWRILANVAKQETVQSNSFPGTREFIARMTKIWNSTITDPRTGAVVSLRNIPRNGYPVGFGPTNPAPPTSQLLGDYLDVNVYVPLATSLATEGSASAEQRKWRANLVTSYMFGRDSIFGGKLNGWSIGGAARWQDKLGLGYPTTRNANSSVTIDIAHPYYSPAVINVDAWLSYTRKLWSNRIDWKMQLNLRNLIADEDPLGITVQPWGDPALARLAPERRWFLTNTFSF